MGHEQARGGQITYVRLLPQTSRDPCTQPSIWPMPRHIEKAHGSKEHARSGSKAGKLLHRGAKTSPRNPRRALSVGLTPTQTEALRVVKRTVELLDQDIATVSIKNHSALLWRIDGRCDYPFRRCGGQEKRRVLSPIQAYGEVVTHRTLTPLFAGSNPAMPASSIKT